MQRAIQIVILLLGLMLMAACSTDKANTVDEAVKLLQDLEDNSISGAIDDGLDVLDEQSGYRAEFHYTATDPEASFTLTVEVDAATNMIAAVQRGETSQYYFVPVQSSTSDTETTSETPSSRPVIRLEGDQPVCLDQSADAHLLRDGLHSVFEDVLNDVVGLRLLAVIDTPDNNVDQETTRVGRDATRYWLESRLDDAIAVLAEIDNADLQTLRDQASNFALDGELVLDEDTAALLALRSNYSAGSSGESTQVEFAVTQWGEVEPITIMADTETLALCP